MTTAAMLNIVIKANSGPAVANLKKTDQQLRRVEQQSKRSEKGVSTMATRSGKSFAVLGKAAKAGGLAIGAGLVVGLKKANDEAREAAKVSRQTAAVLKSTGGAANVSKKQVEGLAGAISRKTGIDDEAIQSSENLLLTFTKVRNETGRGNKVFNQATGVITDMSAALGQDMKASTVQVGKALNDPIKGITALSRVGVTFTAQQKAQIKTMVQSGNTLGAQKAILKELGTEFGGSAAAQADGMDKLKVAAGNVLVVVGGPLSAGLSTAAGALATFLNQVQTGTGTGGRFAAAMSTAFAAVKGAVSSAVTFVSGFLARNREDIRQTGQAFANVGKGIAAVFTNVVLPVIRRVFPGIRQIVQGQLRIVSGIIKVFTGLFTGDFRKAWAGIKQIFSGALKNIGGIVRAASAPLREAASAVFRPIGRVARDVFNGVKEVVKTAIRFVLNRLQDVLQAASHIPIIGKRFGDAAKGVGRLNDALDGTKRRKLTDVRVRLHFKVPGVGRGSLPGFGGPEMNTAIQSASQQYANANKSRFAPLFEGRTGVLGTAKGTLGKFEGLGHKFGLSTTSGFRPGDPGWHGKNRARDLSNGVDTPEMLKYARYMSAHYGKSLLELIHTPLGYGIKDGKRVPLSYWGSKTNAGHHNHVHVAAQRGAMVPGTGVGDKVPAMLEAGEGIINKRAVRAMGGRTAINALNAAVPRFAGGGIVTAADAARKAGFKGATLRTMIAIAGRESHWNPRAQNLNAGTGDHSIGLWQINQLAHHGRFGSDAKLKNPYTNAVAAWKLYREAGLRPWAGRGSYSQYYDDADRAIKALNRGGGKGKGSPKAKRRLAPFIKGDVEAAPMKGRKGFRPQRVTRVLPAGGLGPLTSISDGETSAGEAVENPLVAAMQLHTESINAQRTEAANLAAELKRNTEFMSSVQGISTREALKALSDVISGNLGGRAAQRNAGPATGQLARY